MKFSVIIPLYNKAPYIRKALESVFAQTYTDYEVIVVDDGSTDDSCAIADEFVREAMGNGVWAIDEENEVKGYRLEVKGDENSGAETNAYINYKLIRQANSGVSAARNNGVAQASGEYIAFLDADDWWDPTYLEKMAQLIADYPEAGLYACNYYYHKDGLNIIKVDITTGYFNYPKEYFKNFAMPVTSISVVISHKVYDEMGGFPVGIKLGEDFLLWAKIAMHYPMVFLNEPLAYYNNTLPPNYRATYHLHKPEEHMLFRMEVIGESLEVRGDESSRADTNTYSQLLIANRPTKADWKSLLDMLRLLGLHSYWLSDEYHALAQKELDKVDTSQQYEFLVKLYRRPPWVQRFKQRLLQMVAEPIALLKRFKQKKKTNKTNVIITNKEYRRSMGLPL